MDWLLPSKVSIDTALRDVIGGHPLVAEIMVRRGIDDIEQAQAFLDPAQYTPSPPDTLPDLDTAAKRLLKAIERQEKILVWGDFDVDGQTSTALLYDALKTLGANVIYHVPHRLKHGHGVQTDVLQEYIEQGIELVLTCDTGVAAHEAVDMAQQAGLTVLITDHHALPPSLPDAPAVVNPQRLPEGHPLRDLPGVGVTYKLVQRLYGLAGRPDEAERFLDLVALGIVADVATQRLDTRYLLQLGIEQLRRPERIGLQALMQSAGVDPSNLSSDTIGFQVGPRLNALGRLDDARLAVELLTTDSQVKARQIASQLELLNNRRKQIEDQIYAAAQEQIAKEPSLLKFEALVLAGDHWHPGVIGIVASRLVEQYHRPTVLLAVPPGEPARGSARSVPGVDIGASIAAQDDMLIGHGGHPGAAGVTLDPDLIPQFRRRLSNTVRETRDPNVVDGKAVDAVVSLDDLSMDLAEELNRLAPFGAGNPPVHLMTPDLRLVDHASFGVKGRHRRLTVEDENGNSQLITWWRGSEYPLPGDLFDLLYIPRINDYRGRRSLQLEWVDSRAVPGFEAEPGPLYEIVDLRQDTDALSLMTTDDYIVWAEGLAAEETPFDPEWVITRPIKQRHRSLVVWTVPPGPLELQQVVNLTGAKVITLIGQHAPDDQGQGFITRLGGLVKYALRVYDGEVSIQQLAGATAQREVTVRQGLEWLVAKGQINLEWLDGDRVRLSVDGATPEPESVAPLEDSIHALLAEAAAYRAYFRSADYASLLDTWSVISG